MRKDYLIGLVISALLIVGLFAGSFFFNPRAEPVVPPIKVPPPKPIPDTIELDDPVPSDNPDAPQDKPSVAPPKAPDVPQPVTIDSLVQPVQPNPPDNLKPDPGINVIPNNPGPGLPTDIQIIDISQLQQKPSPRAQIPPQYPFEMKTAGIEGEVVVEFIVDVNGEVRNPFIVRSTHQGFESAALQAIVKWKFRPGKKDGRVVNTGRVQQLITFSIKD